MNRSRLNRSRVLFLVLGAGLASAPIVSAPVASARGVAQPEQVRTDQGPSQAEVAWAREHAVRLVGPVAGAGFDDLEPLRAMIGDARIVALGESTHGTREQFQMKHRLLEFLASEMGFTVFSIEASSPESYAVDAYVSRGEGDPRQLVGGMLFWTWNTEEVLDMVRWMRDFNERPAAQHANDAGGANAGASAPRVRFTGFDMQSPGKPLAILDEALAGDDELAGKLRDLRQAVRDVAAGPMGGAQSAFGVATGTFPAEAAAGKKVRYSGWIRTENVENGFAGLWWRADLADGGIGAFNNMADRGPRGTTDWQRFSVGLDIPAGTNNINFGVIMPGTGRAWFDELTIEVDGKPWSSPNLDLSFDGDTLVGLGAGLVNNYRVTIDRDVKHAGAGSLRLESVQPAGDAVAGKATAAQGLERAKAFSALLAGAKQRVMAATPGMNDEAFAWLAFNARLIEQFMSMHAEANGYAARDRAMAENVRWILEQDPEAKVVLWAHNMHVSTIGPNMGVHLREWYGDGYVSVGFATARGQYTAIRMGQGLHQDNPLQAPPPRAIERVLDEAGLEWAVLDARPTRAGGTHADAEGSAFLRTPRPLRAIGAGAMDAQFFPITYNDAFDLLVWTRDTTAARQLTGPRAAPVEP
jgi:erythromycin esterase-like protein